MTEFVVAHDHPSLPGHFPGRPVVPGVVILDHVVAAIESAHGLQGGLALPQVKFIHPLLPGQAARIELADIDPGDHPSRWRFRVLHGDTMLASGEVRAASVDAASRP